MTSRSDALNDALERLDGLGFEMVPGFSSHGPMGAETLSTLGHDDDVAGWVEAYKAKHRHFPLPPLTTRIDDDGWRSALGDMGRISDWRSAFNEQLSSAPWQEILARWVPRLIEGYGGGLTHGLIRTAHAVRGFDGAPVPAPAMLDELAQGLAYWAARYTPLAGDPKLAGPWTLAESLARVPRLVPDKRLSMKDAGDLGRVGQIDGFADAVDGISAPPVEVDPISELTSTFCRVLLDHPEVHAVPMVHLVTPASAMRILLPLVPEIDVLAVYAQVWQVNAAILAAFTQRGEGDLAEHDQGLAMDDVLARAVGHGDTHVLKFAEACAREHVVRPDPVYATAAAHVLDSMPAW